MTTNTAPAARPTCPQCGDTVDFDGGLFHCDTDGAWDRASLVWIAANGATVEDPSDYSRRAYAADLATCRCGDALSDHIGGKPCVFGTPRGEVRLHDLPIFGRFWGEDARDRRA